MKIELDDSKLGKLTPIDVAILLRHALSCYIDRMEGCSGYENMNAERAVQQALPDPDEMEDFTPRAPTDEDLSAWVAKVSEMREEHRREHFPNLKPDPLTIEKGRKYARIVTNMSNGQSSVYCFVSLENGDILKAATWRAPAKHPRGNIFAPDPLAGCGVYGAEYLR